MRGCSVTADCSSSSRGWQVALIGVTSRQSVTSRTETRQLAFFSLYSPFLNTSVEHPQTQSISFAHSNMFTTGVKSPYTAMLQRSAKISHLTATEGCLLWTVRWWAQEVFTYSEKSHSMSVDRWQFAKNRARTLSARYFFSVWIKCILLWRCVTNVFFLVWISVTPSRAWNWRGWRSSTRRWKSSTIRSSNLKAKW